MIQVAVVQYGNGKSLCWAPYASVFVGDEVETDFCRGTVIQAENILASGELWKMLNECMKVDRVNAVIRKIDYKDEGVKDDAISD